MTTVTVSGGTRVKQPGQASASSLAGVTGPIVSPRSRFSALGSITSGLSHDAVRHSLRMNPQSRYLLARHPAPWCPVTSPGRRPSVPSPLDRLQHDHSLAERRPRSPGLRSTIPVDAGKPGWPMHSIAHRARGPTRPSSDCRPDVAVRLSTRAQVTGATHLGRIRGSECPRTLSSRQAEDRECLARCGNRPSDAEPDHPPQYAAHDGASSFGRGPERHNPRHVVKPACARRDRHIVVLDGVGGADQIKSHNAVVPF